MAGFLPITAKDMDMLGWRQCDFVLVTGDAYVDHPSFGHALIARLLESRGFRVGIIPQPDWRSADPLRILGKPKLAFLITSGNLDSMVNLYTAARKIRSSDSYSPGGRAGFRPERAAIVYSNRAREAFKGVPVILGGIEASLRRLAHYDYWSDSLRRSILLDSKADLLVYGMGETAITEIARRLSDGEPAGDMTDIRGTVYKSSKLPEGKHLILPDHEKLKTDRTAFAESFRIQYRNCSPWTGQILVEPYGKQFVVQNPPSLPLSRQALDSLYELPYTGTFHPTYKDKGGIPALEEVQFSLTSSRGCFGSCSFCALAFHQGSTVSSRSHESLLREAEKLTRLSGFKGYIHDVGGPTANFRAPACGKQEKEGSCENRQCLYPDPCKNLVADHSDYLSLLKKISELPGIKKVFIRSGIRFDYLLADRDHTFFRELCLNHISGQLKVAPEHVSQKVLNAMGKPKASVFTAFKNRFDAYNRELKKKQYLVPYFISGHPGSDMAAAVELAEFMRDNRIQPEQVQDFYPTPGTLSTCMYYTGIDPRTMESIFVPSAEEKRLQRALLQFRKIENRPLVRKALIKAGRRDLIGTGKKALVPPGPAG